MDVMAVPTRKPLTPDDPRHGTANGYTNHLCRCPPCRMAHYAYLRKRVLTSAQPPTDAELVAWWQWLATRHPPVIP